MTKRPRRPRQPACTVDYRDPPPSRDSFGVEVRFRSFADIKRGQWTEVAVLVPEHRALEVKRALADRGRGDHVASIYLVIESPARATYTVAHRVALAQRLKQWRLARKLTLTEQAEKIGLRFHVAVRVANAECDDAEVLAIVERFLDRGPAR